MNDEYSVVLSIGGENLQKIDVFALFDEGGHEVVQFLSILFNIVEGREPESLELCNTLNGRYRFGKLYIDENKLYVQFDAVLDLHSAGETCFALALLFGKTVDAAYMEFMRMYKKTPFKPEPSKQKGLFRRRGES